MKIKKGDRVVVIAGKDKGKEGKVLQCNRVKDRVIVEGVNMISKHMKPNKSNQTGGIINKEASIHASNVMFLFKGEPTRIGHRIEKSERDGKVVKEKHRIAKSTGELID